MLYALVIVKIYGLSTDRQGPRQEQGVKQGRRCFLYGNNVTNPQKRGKRPIGGRKFEW